MLLQPSWKGWATHSLSVPLSVQHALHLFLKCELVKSSACMAGEEDDQAIELAFSKKKIEERKQWLAGFEPGTYLDQSVDEISYSDFVNKVRCKLVSFLVSMLGYPGDSTCPCTSPISCKKHPWFWLENACSKGICMHVICVLPQLLDEWQTSWSSGAFLCWSCFHITTR